MRDQFLHTQCYLCYARARDLSAAPMPVAVRAMH